MIIVDYLTAYARAIMRRLWMLMRPVPVVSLAKPDGRNAPVVWRDPAEEDGWRWRETLHEMLADPVRLVKTVEMQHARRVHRAIVAEQRAIQERSITDELGTWDPDAVDWLEPAVYREAGLAVLQRGLFRGVVRFNPQLVAHAMDLALST